MKQIEFVLQSNDGSDIIKKIEIELPLVYRDYYCPLKIEMRNAKGRRREIDAVDACFDGNVAEELKVYQEDAEITKIVGKKADIRQKLLYIVWNLEEINKTMYGRISCYLNKPLSSEETERLKDVIKEQNEQRFTSFLATSAFGKVYVSFGAEEDYCLMTSTEMDEYLQKNDIKMGGI